MPTRSLLTSLILLGSLSPGFGSGAIRADDPPIKVVVHLNTGDVATHEHGLKNVANILTEDPLAQVEVVCHSGGISLLEKTHSSQKEMVSSLSRQGVKFVACENTMRQKSIKKADLLLDAGTVPSGAVEVIRKQQAGFAYFKP